jgi:hypothetical protein
METDFTALASRVAARAEMLGCLILSRDGLVLGSFPPGGERDVTPAWLRFSALGQPERGFLTFPNELWAYTTHGDFAAFAVAAPTARAGIVIDVLDQALMEVQEAHFTRTAVRAAETVNLTYPGPRETMGPSPPPSRTEQGPLPDEGMRSAADAAPHSPAPVAPMPPAPGLPPSPSRPGGGDMEEPAPQPESMPSSEDIDRVALAREFAQLLQENPQGTEEGP